MPKNKNKKGLSAKKKRQLDRMFDNLIKYFQTEEGMQFSEDVHKHLERWRKAPEGPVLTERESRALAFINRERAKGRSPSVREVTKAIGFKSSRTGYMIVKNLKMRGLM